METRVLMRREKFWPLAADDYVIAAILVGAVLLGSPLGLVIAWSLALGSLYATLFARFDPAYDGVRKWRLIAVAMVVCVVGLSSSVATLA